jgi:hypothetical protein
MFWRNRLVIVGFFGIERNRVASLLILTLKFCSVSKRVDLASGGYDILYAKVQSLIKFEVTIIS